MVRLNCDHARKLSKSVSSLFQLPGYTGFRSGGLHTKESCHAGVGVDRDNRPRYLIDYLLPVILTAHTLEAMSNSVSSPFHQRPWRTVSDQENCTSKEFRHVFFCCNPGVVVTSSSEGVSGETFPRRFQSSVSSPLFMMYSGKNFGSI